MGTVGEGHRHRRRVIDGDNRKMYLLFGGSKRTALVEQKQVRPALAEPDQPMSGNRCLTIEALARGLQTGPTLTASGRLELRSLSFSLSKRAAKETEIRKNMLTQWGSP